jgi:hypothetical protein
MANISEPGQFISTHDLILTLGATEVPLILCDRQGKHNPLAFTRQPMNRGSLKMYSGTQKYADLEPPWTPVCQSDWSGGRGSKDFDNDQSMYFDGYNVNTCRPGEVILGPKATSVSLTPVCTNTIQSAYIMALTAPIPTSATYYEAYRFTAATTITAASVTVSFHGLIVDTGSLQIALAAVDTGVPKAADLAATLSTTTFTLTSITGTLTSYNFTLAAPLALTATTDYFLIFKFTSLDTTPTYLYTIFAQASTTALSADERKTSSNGSDWTSASITGKYEPYFIAYAADKNSKMHFFEYKGAQYAVGQNDDAATNKLYINGDQGVVETGSTVTSVIASSSVKTWTANEAAGCILKIVRGTGTNQPQWWRPITVNDATGTTGAGVTVFTVSPAFDVAPADNDTFAIVASDDWTEVVGFDTNYKTATSGIIPNVTDVLVANGAIYFAMGTQVITRVYAYNSSGTWTYDYSDFGTYTAGSVAETGAFTYLGYASDQAGTYIWGASGSVPSTIAYATPVDFTATSPTPAALSFSSAINVGNLYERITGIEVYGDYGNLHVLKEGSLWQIVDKKPYRIDVREMGNTIDDRNGRAHTVHGKYLYFSWHGTLLRYIEGYLDTVGPDKAEVGTPTPDRAGHFSCLTGYKGLVLGSIDAGTTGVSSVLAYNGQGYCELYSGTLGSRIQNIYVQSIPGNTVDRLWISEGAKIVWIPLSTDPFNHPDTSYLFSASGYLISPWYYVGLQEVDKLFNAIKLVIENAGAATEWVTVSYQVDGDTSWTDLSNDFDTFSEEKALSSVYDLDGKRIRFKYSLYSHDGAESPRIIASVLEAAVRVPTKYVTQVMCRLEDDDTTRAGAPDETRLAITKFNSLVTMQASAVPASVQCVHEMIDGKYAFVDDVSPVTLAVNDKEGKKNRYAVSLSLIEVS